MSCIKPFTRTDFIYKPDQSKEKLRPGHQFAVNQLCCFYRIFERFSPANSSGEILAKRKAAGNLLAKALALA